MTSEIEIHYEKSFDMVQFGGIDDSTHGLWAELRKRAQNHGA